MKKYISVQQLLERDMCIKVGMLTSSRVGMERPSQKSDLITLPVCLEWVAAGSSYAKQSTLHGLHLAFSY
jgi:hypothetical protein